jgi:ABC-type dipeptide/oligopeptide/nickel transport system permease subunit
MTSDQATDAPVMDAAAAPAPAKVWRQGFVADLLRHRGGVFGVAVLGLFIVLAVLGWLLTPYDPNVGELASTLSGPTWQHLFGTDELGRDTLSRVIDGSRIAVVVALLSVAIAIVYTPRFARIARASALSVKTSEYLEAARLAGVTTPAILVRHMLPNVLPSVIVLAALSMSTAQLAYASLSFLGLGVSPPQADWGSMLSKARDFITIAPWLTVWPIAALVALMLAFNVLGDAIRDVLDPRHSGAARPEAAL